MAFPDLNICGSRIRFAHYVNRHFENTKKAFLVSAKARERKENEEIRDDCVPFSEVVDGRFAVEL